MPYCSLEEAWGSDFKSTDYFAKVNQQIQPASNIHSRMPPELPKETVKPSENIPSYSGSVPSPIQTMQSNIVPYKVNFPDRAKRNFIHPINDEKNENDDLDVLEDNDHDIRHIDIQRRVKPEYEPDYMTSEDYFLYKKYLGLAEKYKAKLRKKFKNFMAEEDNKNILEHFSNINTNNNESYSFKDIFIIVVVGIFIIFALDIFVKMGARMHK